MLIYSMSYYVISVYHTYPIKQTAKPSCIKFHGHTDLLSVVLEKATYVVFLHTQQENICISKVLAGVNILNYPWLSDPACKCSYLTFVV